MINESEMKAKNAKNEKWDLLCKPNMALRETRDLRPHLVLEGSFEPKTFWRQEREREKS